MRKLSLASNFSRCVSPLHIVLWVSHQVSVSRLSTWVLPYPPGYVFHPDEARKLLDAYEQVKDEPRILLDLSEANWLTSIGVAAIARVVAMSFESPTHQEVYVVVKEDFKERYFDERPWADGRVFVKEEDIPANL